jgi:hypothetical protein
MASHAVFYTISALVAAALVTAVGALVARAASARAAPRAGVLRAMLAVAAAVWALHYAEMWRPVNWGYAAARLTAWPGGRAFALAAPLLAAAAYALAWRLASRRPLLAALLPLAWCLGYRWHLVQLLRWRAPGEFFAVDDDPAGAWLFARTFALTAALALHAALLRAFAGRPAPRPAPRAAERGGAGDEPSAVAAAPRRW